MSVYNFNSLSAKSHMVRVNLVLLRTLCMKSDCFRGKFTFFIDFDTDLTIGASLSVMLGIIRFNSFILYSKDVLWDFTLSKMVSISSFM